MDEPEILVKAESWFKTELKENWFKILMGIAVLILVWTLLDDVRGFLRKDNKVVVQTPAPININSAGQVTPRVPDIYVNLQTQGTTEAVAQMKEKVDPKNDPDFVVDQKQQTYTMSFNGGKPMSFMPDFKEFAKLDKGQFNYSSTSSMNINVEVPQPKWGIGIGKATKGGYAVQADYRIAKTPFNVWGYASQADQAIGLKFVQYNSK